jgi:hypothetical protein
MLELVPSALGLYIAIFSKTEAVNGNAEHVKSPLFWENKFIELEKRDSLNLQSLKLLTDWITQAIYNAKYKIGIFLQLQYFDIIYIATFSRAVHGNAEHVSPPPSCSGD